MIDAAIKVVEPVGKAILAVVRHFEYVKVEEVVKPASIQHYRTGDDDGPDTPARKLAA